MGMHLAVVLHGNGVSGGQWLPATAPGHGRQSRLRFSGEITIFRHRTYTFSNAKHRRERATEFSDRQTYDTR